MSMYRQLLLAVVVSTLLALVGGLLGSTLNARAYLQEQLRMKNEDNAAVLALSLSQEATDAVEVELTVSALFDSGHYELVRVTDPYGKVIVERIAPAGQHDAPEWFARLLPIQPAPGRAQISNGWKQVGTVVLASHSRFAYRSLWNGAVELVIILGLAGAVSGYLGTLILRRLRRPLAAVIDQARAITEHRFITITEPRVPELRQLAAAMNLTVGQLKAMFEEAAERLEAVRREANSDAVTGIANRSYFMACLRGAIEGENATGGALLLVRIAGLAGLNRRLGREATDELLHRMARVLAECADTQAEGLAARLNGSDFAILLPGVTQARETAEHVLRRLVREGAAYFETGPTAFVGMGAFDRDSGLGEVLAHVDAALASAEAAGLDGVREAIIDEEKTEPKSGVEWSRLIGRALEQNWVRLVSFPVTGPSEVLIHRECPLRLMFDEQGEWLPAGSFLPMAERLGLTSRLDMAAVALGLEQLAENTALPGLAVNLSASSLENAEFRRELSKLISRQTASAGRLWLEIAEAGAFRHFEAFQAFCRELAGSGCHIGLEHFGHQFSEIGRLHDLGLDYLKVDASFIHGLEANRGNQAFLKGLSGIAHGIGLQVFAEGVVSADELKVVYQIGFDGATGPVIKDANT